MHDDVRHFDLALPLIPVGENETPYNLSRLLYRGGASVRVNNAEQAIREGSLGNVDANRVDLVSLIHEYINGNLAGGGSAETSRRQIAEITVFFGWADSKGETLSVAEVIKTYLNWSEHLLQRHREVKNLNAQTIYARARIVGQVLDEALGRAKPILRSTRIKRPRTQKTPQGREADKQNLNNTSAFGRLLQDICDGTSLSVIWEEQRVRIPLRQGGEIKYAFNQRKPKHQRKLSDVTESTKNVLLHETRRAIDCGSRKNLINLRIQAELLMFIGQTGMNIFQAQNLPLCRFSYSSDIDGYKVRDYKERRQGAVLFEIFAEYRSHLERYLEWRREIFPDTENRVFPYIRQNGIRKERRLKFDAIQNTCEKVGVIWTSPRILRGTRVNWLLRRSGDPDLTSEMAQHHKQVLLNVYEKPSQQRAISEITQFHLRNDPALAEQALMLSVAPGECDGTPKMSPTKPETAAEPDCRRPSGCLWCEHHRDIDTLDYVWSLACFRHLKIIELGRQPPAKQNSTVIHPADHTIQRLSEKLSWFRESNSTRREWVEESLARVEESHYHGQWSYLIEYLESSSE